MRFIKRYLPKLIKDVLMRIHCLLILLKYNLHCVNTKRCYVFMTPQFGNIGDQAIAQAQYEFLADNLSEYKIVEIPFKYFMYSRRFLVKKVRPRDIIVLHGGGNIGTLWPAFEAERQEIIKAFPGNRIVSFPQSVFYSNDNNGITGFKKSIEIYSSHTDFHLFIRERYSFDIMQNAGLHHVYLVPDIVLYLDRTEPSYPRQGILMCFRNDKEKNISEDSITDMEKCLKKYTDNVIRTDTVIEKRIPIPQRDRVINAKLEQFKRAKLVLTDRLHGLIFAAITATPCIAFGNNYHKIKGISEWVRHLNYIRFCEDESEIESYINDLWSLEECCYNSSYFKSEFDKMSEVLKDF